MFRTYKKFASTGGHGAGADTVCCSRSSASMTTTRFRHVATFTGLSILLVAAAQAQTTLFLDDYSTDKFGTNYVQKNVDGFIAGGWNVTGGVLAPITSATGGYAAFTWTSNSLHSVGDSFSIDVSVSTAVFEHNGGLSLWTSNTTAYDRILEPRLNYNGGYAFVGSDQANSLWADNVSTSDGSQPITLTLSLLSRDATSETVSAAISNSNGLLFSHQYIVNNYTGDLYVGPSVWQGDGGTVVFDNLSYTPTSAVPEPSTYAAFAGALALGFAAWRRRRLAAAP